MRVESGKGVGNKPITVKVPRHNAVKVSSKVVSQIQIASPVRYSNDALDAVQNRDLALAIENASEWNSLLLTARAERGPQWDVGTQVFHVDVGSDLYYDATPLLSTVREKQKLEDEANGIDRKADAHSRAPNALPPHMNNMPPHGRDSSPRHHGPGPQPHHMPPGNYPGYPSTPNTRSGGPPGGMGNMNGIPMNMPPNQFYPGGQPPMGASPGMGMHMMDSPGGMSPEMTRRRQPPRGASVDGMPLDYEARYPMR